MLLLAAALLFLGALLLLSNGLLTQRRRERQIAQRLQGNMTRDSRLGSWLRLLGDSRFGQRAVNMDSETQTLLNRLGWRRSTQRSLFAACQIGHPGAGGVPGDLHPGGGVSPHPRITDCP